MSSGTKGILAGCVLALLLAPLVFVACEAAAVGAAWFTWDVLEMRLLGPAESSVLGALCGVVSMAVAGLFVVVVARTLAVRLLA